MNSNDGLYKEEEKHWRVVSSGVNVGENITARDIWISALKYFQWCDDNPIMKREVIRNGKEVGKVVVNPVQRPYTLVGVSLHLGISREYLLSASRSQEQNDYYFVANRILDIIHTQNFEYSLVGIFNPAVSIKMLGLFDPPSRGDDGVFNILVDSQAPKLLTNEADAIEKS